MAEWRKVAKAFALGDGPVSGREVDILRNALFADGNISKSELDFLLDLKSSAKTSVQKLDELIKDCEKAQGT